MRPLVSQGLASGDLAGASRNIVRYLPEKTAWTRVQVNKVFFSQLMSTVGVQDPSAVLSLSQGELLSTKTTSWTDTAHLARTVIQKLKGRITDFDR